MKTKRIAAAVGASGLLAALGFASVGAAQADTTNPGTATSSTGAESGAEVEESSSDGPDQGPDANPNEPGHQDADSSGDAATN